jgi:hypothetical protein
VDGAALLVLPRVVEVERDPLGGFDERAFGGVLAGVDAEDFAAFVIFAGREDPNGRAGSRVAGGGGERGSTEVRALHVVAVGREAVGARGHVVHPVVSGGQAARRRRAASWW